MSLPAEPRLLPGLPVLRRDATHLQVGLQGRSAVLPDLPEVRALLHRLAGLAPTPPPGACGGAPPAEGPAVALALSRLAEAGMLVGRAQLQTLTGYAVAPAERAAAASALHRSPEDAARRWVARSRATVRVDAPGVDASALERTLSQAGVRPRVDEPDLVVVLRDREPVRDDLDRLVQADCPHLLVRAELDRVVLGPFVVPGSTACLRCLDAHLTDRDPRRPLLLEQHVHADLATVRDPALWQLALGWVARDVLTWLDGEQPSTWSATVTVGADLEPVRRSWRRHPHCGCGWDDLHGPGAGSRSGAGHQNSESSLPSMERRFAREQLSQ